MSNWETTFRKKNRLFNDKKSSKWFFVTSDIALGVHKLVLPRKKDSWFLTGIFISWTLFLKKDFNFYDKSCFFFYLFCWQFGKFFFFFFGYQEAFSVWLLRGFVKSCLASPEVVFFRPQQLRDAILSIKVSSKSRWFLPTNL